MIDVPVSWVSYRDYNPAKGRWDQNWLQRMLEGEEGCPPLGYRFVETPWTPSDGRGRVIVFPAGSYGEHDEARPALERFIADLYKLEWAVVFATSDECQSMPWGTYFDSWPSHVKLWVQLPRVDHLYPAGTRFFGEGSPASAKQIAAHAERDWAKDIDVFFSGQMGHDRRTQMWEHLGPMRDRDDMRVIAQVTGGFLQGMDYDDYAAHLARSWIVPCPSGICSQSSFRVFEALEAQCIPLADALRPGSRKTGFWEMIGLEDCVLRIDDWADLPPMAEAFARSPAGLATLVHLQAEWQQYKRRTLINIHDDVHEVRAAQFIGDDATPDDLITVIIPTSPVPSNPSLDIIQETIASVRERLPLAEILITCDDVRGEQRRDRSEGYWEFLRRLCAWTNTQPNITPWVMRSHQHQSGMMRQILPIVSTPYLAYVEHDCPLIGDIPFDAILRVMEGDEIALMRFYHEAEIHPEHAHLFLDPVRRVLEDWTDIRYIPTVQWSQRPHLARVDFYRNLMSTYFSAEARTMIEDAIYGIVLAGVPDWHPDAPYQGRIRAEEAWRAWRLAIYAPEGEIKRSTHLDAREGDPKYPMFMSYPLDRPEGAPPEGWTE